MKRQEAIYNLAKYPYALGHMIGFTKLTPLHNEWIKRMTSGTEDETLQAHRGSYKTTCVSLALSIIMVTKPNKKILFMRKTDADTKESIAQVKKILLSQCMQKIALAIRDKPLILVKASATEITTNLTDDPRGTSQLFSIGIGGSLTGKHFDIIFTDDIDQVGTTGPELECHPAFPQRCNIEFAQVLPDGRIRTRVWERGSGITQACGTGACATAVAACLTERAGRTSNIVMDGGTLHIEWCESDNHVYMTGPAEFAFDGEIEL